MSNILDFNNALQEKELADYLSKDQGPDRDMVLSGLNKEVEQFSAWLFPAAVVSPRNVRVGNVHGSAGTSLVIETKGSKRGLWKDFADPAQKGGNLIDLYMAVHGVGFPKALSDLADWVGHGSRPEINYQREQAVRKLKRVERDLGPQKGEWHYTDADGSIIASVYRFEPDDGGKEFLPWDAVRRCYGNPAVRPLYNLPKVLQSASVVVCEGEKAADAVIGQGVVATCVMGGSNSPLDQTDLEPLRGRSVIIWPDNDEPGRKFAAAFALAIEGIASEVRMLPAFEDKPEGWDAADAAFEEPEVMRTILQGSAELTHATLGEMLDSPFSPKAFTADCLDSIPPRKWLLGHRLQRGKATGGVAPGGVGKSAFSLATAIAIASNDRRLTGEQVHETGAALVIYNEEDYDELHRRIAAICQFWNIEPRSLEGRLHTLCSVSGELKVVTMDKNGSAVVMPEVDLMVEYCKAHQIIYVCCDPFITFHTMPENDNTNIDIAARQFSRIAHDANVAIDLLHHISKGDGDSEGHAGDITRARGAAALSAAIRNSYTLAAMSQATGAKLAIDEEYVRFVRLDDGKRNYSLRSGETSWFYLESVEIANGDSVGVIRPYDMSQAERQRNDRNDEALNLEREQMLVTISSLMATPEMPISQLSVLLENELKIKNRKARTIIQSVVPPHPASVEMHDCKLWLERQGSSQTSPILVMKEIKR